MEKLSIHEDIKEKLNQFIKNFVDEFKNQSVVKYEDLWKWSIEKPEKFWDSIWDYSNVLGEKGEILLKDKDKMPGARFFPNAKLNYTENVLKNKNEPCSYCGKLPSEKNCKEQNPQLN